MKCKPRRKFQKFFTIMSPGGQYLATTTKIGGYFKILIQSGAVAVVRDLMTITSSTLKPKKN